MSNHIGMDTITPTQGSDRNLGLIGTIFLWIAATLVIPTVMTGQMFVPDVSPFDALEAVFFASILGCIALAAIAVIGTKTGLTTFIVARSTFGHNGSKLFAGVSLLILCGWGFIQGYLGGLALNQVLNGLFGIDNLVLSIFITQGLVLVITILGHTGIQRIEGLASSMMLIIAFVVIYSLLDKHGLTKLENLPLSDSPALTYAIAFDIVLATAFSWMSLPCDYNRYCKSKMVSAMGISIGYLSGTLIAMGLGVVVGAYSIIEGMEPTYDASQLLDGNFGVAAAMVMFLSVATTNIMNLYSIVMSTMSIVPKAKYSHLTIMFGIMCLGGSFLQEILMTSFFDWVLLVGALLIPVFAIILTDYYLVNNLKVDVDAILDPTNPRYSYTGGFNLTAIVAYVCSACFAFYFTYEAPMEFGSTAITFFFTSAFYFILKKITLALSRNELSVNKA